MGRHIAGPFAFDTCKDMSERIGPLNHGISLILTKRKAIRAITCLNGLAETRH
jgi:hypothetical protein